MGLSLVLFREGLPGILRALLVPGAPQHREGRIAGKAPVRLGPKTKREA